MRNKSDNIAPEVSYYVRIMACIVVAELLVLLVITLWPPSGTEKVYQDIVFSDNNAVIDAVQITRQSSSPPSPPKPQVPIPVPNDEVIEDQIIDFEDVNLSDYTDPLSLEGIGREGNSDRVSGNPQRPPSVVRIVEPTVPEAAKKANIKAEVWVSFLVDKNGSVEEATIAQIRLYDKREKSYQTVDHIEYGLAEATLHAALQWKFRPAKDDGEIVKSYTKHIFTYGF